MKTTQSEHVNRTGLSLHPDLARSLVEGARASEPSSSGDDSGLALVRVQYAAEAEPLGSMPAMAGQRAPKLQGTLALFLDKLGERLAFERSGVRLYDALLSKYDAFGSWPRGPSRADLELIRSQEREHFLLLNEAIRDLGGDPTVVTPSADLHAVASKGLVAVMADPRTTLRQCLEAILVAELVDNDCWRNLTDIAVSRGEHALAEEFERAIQIESEHLVKVRAWVSAALEAVTGEAGQARPAPSAPRRKSATPARRASTQAPGGRASAKSAPRRKPATPRRRASAKPAPRGLAKKAKKAPSGRRAKARKVRARS